MTPDTRAHASRDQGRDSEVDFSEHAARQKEYEEMLEKLEVAADQCLYKIDGGGRITDAKKETARVKWVNALTRVLKERRQILEARELEQLEEQIENLKEQQERGR